MKKIGIFYGTTSGNTTGIVDEIEFYLRKELENCRKIGTMFLKSLKI